MQQSHGKDPLGFKTFGTGIKWLMLIILASIPSCDTSRMGNKQYARIREGFISPQEDRYTWILVDDIEPGEELQPSGLIGPVTIQAYHASVSKSNEQNN